MSATTFLRIGVVLQLGLGFLVAWWLLPARFAWLAVPIALLVPLVGTGIVLAIEFAVGAITDPRKPPLPWRDLIAVWWQETLISTRMFGFSQLFAAGFPEKPLVRDSQRPAVLLVHGYLCNRAVWRALLDSDTLEGCNVATVDLQPIFGPLERYADVIAHAVERLRAATGQTQVALVGHSMGGLAIRAYLARFGDAAVSKVVTLASPHQGTVFGRLGSGANARQMAVASPYMREITQPFLPALAAKFICVATRDDNLIVPRSSPLLPGTRHVVLERVGHLALIEDPRAWQVLAQELRAPTARLAA